MSSPPAAPPRLSLSCDSDIWGLVCDDCDSEVSVMCGSTPSDALYYNSTDQLRDFCSGLTQSFH